MNRNATNRSRRSPLAAGALWATLANTSLLGAVAISASSAQAPAAAHRYSVSYHDVEVERPALPPRLSRDVNAGVRICADPKRSAPGAPATTARPSTAACVNPASAADSSASG